jgi:lipopolysaccharide transport system ATP-binding protein
MSTVIKIENVSKQYRLGSIGTNTLKGDLQRWWYNLRGLPDPTLIIGQENSLRNVNIKNKVLEEYVWALKDISFEVKQGEILGIIGKNGAGKSTLLKLLSRVTAPTTGNIKVKGRIASLLEVGTGFHPELTGRENIFLNGAILGMSKSEIKAKFDEIVDFAGVAKYIDTPVKRYSSGMYVRLAFAVAAHLEPEILIVDEVLAVGDAEFQKKAIGKMQDVSAKNGRTVLFVSHNMNAIKSICNNAILLSNGKIFRYGSVDEIINDYYNSEVGLNSRLRRDDNLIGDDVCILLDAKVLNNEGLIIDHQEIDKEVRIEFSFQIKRRSTGIPNLHLFTLDGSHVFFSSDECSEYNEGIYSTILIIPGSLLNTGTYIAGLAFTTLAPFSINFYLKDALMFEITENINNRKINYVGHIPGIIRPNLKWNTKSIN